MIMDLSVDIRHDSGPIITAKNEINYAQILSVTCDNAESEETQKFDITFRMGEMEASSPTELCGKQQQRENIDITLLKKGVQEVSSTADLLGEQQQHQSVGVEINKSNQSVRDEIEKHSTLSPSCDYRGSLLVLAEKLRQAETKVLGTQSGFNTFKPQLSESSSDARECLQAEKVDFVPPLSRRRFTDSSSYQNCQAKCRCLLNSDTSNSNMAMQTCCKSIDSMLGNLQNKRIADLALDDLKEGQSKDDPTLDNLTEDKGIADTVLGNTPEIDIDFSDSVRVLKALRRAVKLTTRTPIRPSGVTLPKRARQGSSLWPFLSFYPQPNDDALISCIDAESALKQDVESFLQQDTRTPPQVKESMLQNDDESPSLKYTKSISQQDYELTLESVLKSASQDEWNAQQNKEMILQQDAKFLSLRDTKSISRLECESTSLRVMESTSQFKYDSSSQLDLFKQSILQQDDEVLSQKGANMILKQDSKSISQPDFKSTCQCKSLITSHDNKSSILHDNKLISPQDDHAIFQNFSASISSHDLDSNFKQDGEFDPHCDSEKIFQKEKKLISQQDSEGILPQISGNENLIENGTLSALYETNQLFYSNLNKSYRKRTHDYVSELSDRTLQTATEAAIAFTVVSRRNDFSLLVKEALMKVATAIPNQKLKKRWGFILSPSDQNSEVYTNDLFCNSSLHDVKKLSVKNHVTKSALNNDSNKNDVNINVLSTLGGGKTPPNKTYEINDSSDCVRYSDTDSPCNMTGSLSKSRKFQCELCPYSSISRSHLLRHQKRIHAVHRPYACYVCLKPYSHVDKIKSHFRTSHPLLIYRQELVQVIGIGEVFKRTSGFGYVKEEMDISDSRYDQDDSKSESQSLLSKTKNALCTKNMALKSESVASVELSEKVKQQQPSSKHKTELYKEELSKYKRKNTKKVRKLENSAGQRLKELFVHVRSEMVLSRKEVAELNGHRMAVEHSAVVNSNKVEARTSLKGSKWQKMKTASIKNVSKSGNSGQENKNEKDGKSDKVGNSDGSNLQMCMLCQKLFKSLSLLKLHVAEEHSCLLFTCPHYSLCRYYTVDSSEYSHHLATVHKDDNQVSTVVHKDDNLTVKAANAKCNKTVSIGKLSNAVIDSSSSPCSKRAKSSAGRVTDRSATNNGMVVKTQHKKKSGNRSGEENTENMKSTVNELKNETEILQSAGCCDDKNAERLHSALRREKKSKKTTLNFYSNKDSEIFSLTDSTESNGNTKVIAGNHANPLKSKEVVVQNHVKHANANKIQDQNHINHVNSKEISIKDHINHLNPKEILKQNHFNHHQPLKSNHSKKPRGPKLYSCPMCLEKPPFCYKKSFNKHLLQHEREIKSGMTIVTGKLANTLKLFLSTPAPGNDSIDSASGNDSMDSTSNNYGAGNDSIAGSDSISRNDSNPDNDFIPRNDSTPGNDSVEDASEVVGVVDLSVPRSISQ